uniref:Death domain-containing protein n=1 Tax=Ornithorhynchus anatinus TaxID=9258 RepID=A0A6I8PN83_ORNAN
MPNKAQEDAVINLKSVGELGQQLGFEWTIVANEQGFSKGEISQFHKATDKKKIQVQKMLECWYEQSWHKLNKTKLLQDALERAGRKDLTDKLRCLHWGHQKLSSRVEFPSAFPFLITVHKTTNNKEGLKKINQLGSNFN